MRLLDVILPLAIRETYTYAVSDSMPLPAVGARVLVPLGKKTITGIVLREHTEPIAESIALREIIEVLDVTESVVSEQQLQLWQWIADYYMCTLGEVLAAALPAGILDDNYKARTTTFIRLHEGIDLPQAIAALARAPKQQHVLETLLNLNSETPSISPLKGENKKSPFKGDLEGLSLPLREGQGGSDSEEDRTRKIALQLLELLGGQPTQGERNNIYYNLCRHLRTICAFSPDWLVRIVPDFGLSLEERCATAASAVNSTRTADKTALLRQAIEMVEKSEQETAEIEEEPEIAQATTTLPPLPKVLEKICSRVPEPYRPALIMACLPILGTLATRVRFNYLDHQQQSFSFMSCIIAPPAAGKSFIRKPTNLLLTPINAQDEVERQKEQDYKDALRAAKNSKQQPENPRPCPRNNGVNISIAKLLQLLSYSDNKHLIGIAEELDTLTKSEKAGVWSQKRDIYRLAFDNAYYGQNYMSDNSFSANVPVYYNLLLTGTPNAAARFFKDVEDGLITRFCFAQLPDMFGQDIPNFEDYSEAEQRFIIGTATQLMDESGEVVCAGVNQHIAKWVKQKGQEAVLEDSRAKDTLRKRAAVIGFRAGYLAYILNGRKYSKEIGQFAVWVAEYTFQNQMELFGSKFEEIMQGQIDEQGKRSHNKVLFEDLPSQFTLGELRQRRAERKLSVTRCAIAMLITRWIRKGLITETAKNEYKKILNSNH